MSTVFEIDARDLCAVPGTVEGRVCKRATPIIVVDVGAVVQVVRAEEFCEAENIPGLPVLMIPRKRETVEELNRQEEQLRSFIDENKAAYLETAEGALHICLVSFDALEVIKRINPMWASRWWWDRLYGYWAP